MDSGGNGCVTPGRHRTDADRVIGPVCRGGLTAHRGEREDPIVMFVTRDLADPNFRAHTTGVPTNTQSTRLTPHYLRVKCDLGTVNACQQGRHPPHDEKRPEGDVLTGCQAPSRQ